MSKSGLEIRAEIDSHLSNSLILVNGGGVIALLAFLPEVVKESDFRALAIAILWALLMLLLGILFGLIHTRLRRKCSLDYEVAGQSSPHYPDSWVLRIFRFEHDFREPKSCALSSIFAFLSGVMFFVAGIAVFIGGMYALS